MRSRAFCSLYPSFLPPRTITMLICLSSLPAPVSRAGTSRRYTSDSRWTHSRPSSSSRPRHTTRRPSPSTPLSPPRTPSGPSAALSCSAAQTRPNRASRSLSRCSLRTRREHRRRARARRDRDRPAVLRTVRARRRRGRDRDLRRPHARAHQRRHRDRGQLRHDVLASKPGRSVAPRRPSAWASTVIHVALCPIIH